MLNSYLKAVLLALQITIIISVGIKIKDGKIFDLQGRQIRFHGPNVVVKVPPYLPIRDRFDQHRSFSKQDMLNLKKWGFNAIRLGMMWAGVQPTPNGYNQTYLDEMQSLINQAGSYGIYTLIDFHQDLLAEKFCGDGVPTWLMDEIKGYRNFPFPIGKHIKLNESGLPSWEDCDQANWGTYYFSRDVSRSFKELYKIGTKLNVKFTEYWKKIATRYRNNKYVIAYQLINEPFAGNPYRNPAILLPSMADRFNFQEFYDNLALQIRKIDMDTPICFEPITFDQKFPSGFSHSPGGNRYKDLSIFCYHYYKPPALGYGTLEARLQDGKRLGIPSMMDEFGTTEEPVLKFAEENQQSWMFWGYKDFGKNWGGSPFSKVQNNNLQNNLEHVRTFMQRISGKLIKQSYDRQTCDYVGSYEAVPGGKSLLFYSTQFYTNGPLIDISPKNELSLRQTEKGYLQITYLGTESKLITISLSKK